MSVNTKENVGFTQLTKRPQVKSLAKQSGFAVFYRGNLTVFFQQRDVLHLGLH